MYIVDKETARAILKKKQAGYDAAAEIVRRERLALTTEQRLAQLAVLEAHARAMGCASPADPDPARKNWNKLRKAWLERQRSQ
jgi:hypothetical protein